MAKNAIIVGYREIKTELADLFVVLLIITSSPCLGCFFSYPIKKKKTITSLDDITSITKAKSNRINFCCCPVFS